MTKGTEELSVQPLGILPQLEIIENAKEKRSQSTPLLVNPWGFFLALNPSSERNAQAENGDGAKSCQ
jgi:hypothetical protein